MPMVYGEQDDACFPGLASPGLAFRSATGDVIMDSLQTKHILSDVDSVKIDDTILDIIENGFVSDVELCQILGHDRQYDEILPQLWLRYQLDIRGPKCPKIESIEDQIGTWFFLLTRLTTGTVAGISAGLKDVTGLNRYCLNLTL